MQAIVSMDDVAKSISIEVKVTGLWRYRFRMHIVLMLFRIASWISPVQIMVNPED